MHGLVLRAGLVLLRAGLVLRAGTSWFGLGQ